MSLGAFPFLQITGEQNTGQNYGLNIIPQIETYTLPSAEFSSGLIQFAVLSYGSVKIAFVFIYSTWSGATAAAGYQLSEVLSSGLKYQAEAINSVNIENIPKNTDVTLSLPGETFPSTDPPNTEPPVLNSLYTQLPSSANAQADSVTVTDDNGNALLTFYSVNERVEDPVVYNVIEPIPEGELEAASTNDFTNTITQGDPAVVALDVQNDQYLIVPENEVVPVETTVTLPSTMQFPFGWKSQPYVLASQSITNDMTAGVIFNSSTNLYDTLYLYLPENSNMTYNGAFLIVGI